MADLIRYEVTEEIVTITIDRPEKRGAMTYSMLAEFIAVVKHADLQIIPGKQRGVRGEAEESEVWWPLVACPKPVIACCARTRPTEIRNGIGDLSRSRNLSDRKDYGDSWEIRLWFRQEESDSG